MLVIAKLSLTCIKDQMIASHNDFVDIKLSWVLI